MITHFAVLAAAHPRHVSDVKYATETWTPGGTVLAVIIIIVLIAAWLKFVPSGPRVTGRRKPRPAAKTWERARVPAAAKPAARPR